MKILTRNHLEKFSENTKSLKDRRKSVSRAIFSYIDTNTGYEYRRSFEAEPRTPEMKFWKEVAPFTIEIK